MSGDELLSALNLSKPVKKGKKTKPDFSKAKIEFNESRHKFSKLKIKEIERNLTELEENLFKTKKYHDYDDIEYKGIRNVRHLFDLSIDKDYYKQIIAMGAFNSSYIQYESKGDKGKNLSIKEYLNIIKRYLSDIINDHKTRGLVRYHSGNKT